MTVTKGSDVFKCEVDSNTYSVNDKALESQYALTMKDDHACIPLDVLAGFFGVSPVVQGDLIVLDGNPLKVEWAYDDLLKTNRAGQTLEEAVLEEIRISMLYERPTADEILEIYESYNRDNSHPRLVVQEDTFKNLRKQMKTDEDLKKED